MLFIIFLSYFLTLSYSQLRISGDQDYKEVIGIDNDGRTTIYNGKITKHWVKTQNDDIKIKEAEINSEDGILYAVARDSGFIYKKSSFGERFTYVACCVTTFTFLDDPTSFDLPDIAKILIIDGNKLKLKEHFEIEFLDFNLQKNMHLVSIANVDNVIVCVDESGKVYTMTFVNGLPSFKEINTPSSFKDNKIVSVSAWKTKGKFLATTADQEAWHSTTELKVWDSFGNGRSCCVNSVFEIPEIESFAEQTFPFCSQANLENVPMLSNKFCDISTMPFGGVLYKSAQSTPCLKYINSSTTRDTAQDLYSDYKISIKAVYEDRSAMIGVAFNLLDKDHYDYVYLSPGNRKDCYGMGHMTPSGPVDRVNLNTGCPGGPPLQETPFVLEVLTIERQVMVKLDGYTIFTEYPHYENIAAGGLLVLPGSKYPNSVVSYGVGVCYVPTEMAYEMEYAIDDMKADRTRRPTEKITVDPREPKIDLVTTDEYSTPGADVTPLTRTTSNMLNAPTEYPGERFDNNVGDAGEDADASIELLSEGITYEYFLYKEQKGFTAANQACAKRRMDLLLIEDEIQNDRVAMLLQQSNVHSVWLGKFWIEEWIITLNDGTTVQWDNFETQPKTSSTPKFAALRNDGLWNVVSGKDRFYYVCQRSTQKDIKDITESNEVKAVKDVDDTGEIPDSFETIVDHPPVIIKGPVNVTAEVGDTVTFKCTASSKPPATVIIVKIDDETTELPSIGDPLQLNDESQRVTTIIELEDITMEDAGKYSCIAQNELGEASDSAWLIIDETTNWEQVGTCSLWGDPHIETYDGKTYNYPGLCTYVLSMDCTSSTFWIYGLFSECGGSGGTGPSLSAMEGITIYARVADGNHTGIELQRGWVINIGAAKLRIGEGMSARHGNLVIKRTAEHVVVTLPNKIQVQWDGLHMAVIKLPKNFGHDRTCGLCGRFNENADDDYYMRFGNTDITDNAIEFGNSWAYPTYYRPCNDVDLNPVDPCVARPDRATEAEMKCYNHLYQVPFTSCHSQVHPQLYYENCKRDYCGSEWRRDQNLPLCNALSAYATACELKKRPISSWRSAELCPIDEIKEITKEEGCPWDELEFDFETDSGERDIVDAP